MSRYYFHLDDHWPFFVDEREGIDLPDDAAACAHGSEVARELAKNNDGADHTIVVTNEWGERVCRMRLHGADAGVRARVTLLDVLNESLNAISFTAGLGQSASDRILRQAATSKSVTLAKEQCLTIARECDEEAEMASDPALAQLLRDLAEQWRELAAVLARKQTFH